MVLAWVMFRDREVVQRAAVSERGRVFERFIPDEPGQPGEYTLNDRSEIVPLEIHPGEYTLNDKGEKAPLEIDAGEMTSGTLMLMARKLEGPKTIIPWRQAGQEILWKLQSEGKLEATGKAGCEGPRAKIPYLDWPGLAMFTDDLGRTYAGDKQSGLSVIWTDLCFDSENVLTSWPELPTKLSNTVDDDLGRNMKKLKADADHVCKLEELKTNVLAQCPQWPRVPMTISALARKMKVIGPFEYEVSRRILLGIHERSNRLADEGRVERWWAPEDSPGME